MTSHGWTPERRAKQRDAIYRWSPWMQSTGPKTDDGKAAVARNAWKHGQCSAPALRDAAAVRNALKLFANNFSKGESI